MARPLPVPPDQLPDPFHGRGRTSSSTVCFRERPEAVPDTGLYFESPPNRWGAVRTRCGSASPPSPSAVTRPTRKWSRSSTEGRSEYVRGAPILAGGDLLNRAGIWPPRRGRGPAGMHLFGPLIHPALARACARWRAAMLPVASDRAAIRTSSRCSGSLDHDSGSRLFENSPSSLLPPRELVTR